MSFTLWIIPEYFVYITVHIKYSDRDLWYLLRKFWSRRYWKGHESIPRGFWRFSWWGSLPVKSQCSWGLLLPSGHPGDAPRGHGVDVGWEGAFYWVSCQSSMSSSCCGAPTFLLLLLSHSHLEDNIPALGSRRCPMPWDKAAFTTKTSLWLQYKTQEWKHKTQILPFCWLQVILKFQTEFKASFFLILSLFIVI